MKGKLDFTQSEANAIVALIRKKLVSDKLGQKKIRNKIRALGFYASDFGIGGGYDEHDFLKVVRIYRQDSKVIIPKNEEAQKKGVKISYEKKRKLSDEFYVLDLCDQVLGAKGLRQMKFDFLRGDSGTKLPVDIYYPDLSLVIEYCERQHTEFVKLFDKKMTISGMSRGEQRKKYDQLRRDILPLHKIQLIEIGYSDFEHNSQKRLLRDKENDLMVIRRILKPYRNVNK